MDTVCVDAFGGSDRLQIVEQPTPKPAEHQVLVRLTSIGMNYADLMARRGEYKLISGNPPFTPGIEGGGYIEAVGSAVRDRQVGQRVVLSLAAPALNGLGRGTYTSHFLTTPEQTVLAPEGVPNELLGALWLPYLTAWGCLLAQQNLQPGQVVLLPAASSSVAIAASQIVKSRGGVTIGTTTSPEKVGILQAMPEAQYDHLVVTQGNAWWREVKRLTQGRGVDIAFDPVAAGDFLNQEIRLLAQGGTIWVYGLLGKPDVVDVTPLIRKMGAIRGWLLNTLSGSEREQEGYQHILESIAQGLYQLPIAERFALRDVRAAHDAMEAGQHIGKFILIP